MTKKLVHQAGVGFAYSRHVVDFCRPGDGAETCRFLVGGIMGRHAGGLHCAKFEPVLAAQITARVEAGSFIARGDNCPGKPTEEVL